MRFDVMEVLRNFVVMGGHLYRKRANGTLKPMLSIEHGKVVVVLQGRKMYGPEVAWACHYHCAPMYPVVTVDMDSLNLAKDNLGMVRVRRLQFRPTLSRHGWWFHSLQKDARFEGENEARRDWIARARRFYTAELDYLLALHRPHMVIPPVEEKPVELLRVSQQVRRERPAPVPGLTWYWFKGQWVAIPPAVHPSDDWQVRAAALLADPDARRVYDEQVERTLTATLPARP